MTRGTLTDLKSGLEAPQAQEGDLERDWDPEREREEGEERADAREIPAPRNFAPQEAATQLLPSENPQPPVEESQDQKQPAETSQPPVEEAEKQPVIPKPGDLCQAEDSLFDPNFAATSWTAAHELFTIYAEERGSLPEARELTAERSQRCAERLRVIGARAAPEFLREFREAVRRTARTPFLCGANGRNWRATFDWLIANDENYRKVLEGRYDAFTRAPFVGEAAGLSQRDSYVQRELRVGLGPPGPHGVKPEAIERDRLRREAERAAALAKNGGAKYCVGSARALAARPR